MYSKVTIDTDIFISNHRHGLFVLRVLSIDLPLIFTVNQPSNQLQETSDS
jgi:hypothetical protein